MAAGGSAPEARVPIGMPVETNADQAADAVAALRDMVAASKDQVGQLAAQMRNLHGKTDAVKAAKDQLRAAIDKEKAAITDATLKLLQKGTSYEQLNAQAKAAAAAADKVAAAEQAEKKKTEELAAATKKLALEQKNLADKAKVTADKLKADATAKAKERLGAMGKAADAAGGPVAALKSKLSALADIAGGEASGGMGLATLAAAGLAAGIAAVVVAAGAGVVALAKFVLSAANAERSMSLMREAAAGSATNAAALGTQIDALARKVPTSRAALNELAVSLAKSGVQGQQLVDTFNAVGQAAAAMGDQAASKIQELVTRSRLSQRLMVNPFELQGTGLSFDDIAKELPLAQKKGIAAARKALLEGAVPLGEGAAALRAAVEKKFAGLNIRKMADLPVIATKLKDSLQKLAGDVNLEPLGVAAARLLKNFDETTVTGQTLKKIVTAFGNETVAALTKAAPLAEKFFQGLIIGSLQTYIAFLKLRKTFKETFGDLEVLEGVDTMKLAFEAGRFAAVSLAVGVTAAAAAVALAIAPFVLVGKAVWDLGDAIIDAHLAIANIDWKATGLAIVDGLVDGITGGAGRLIAKIKGLADDVKGAFTGKLEIHSPSKAFARFGRALPEGVAEGVDDGAPRAQRAVEAMVTVPAPPSGGAGGGESRGPLIGSITLNFIGGAKPDDIDEESVVAKVTDMLRRALVASGRPVEG